MPTHGLCGATAPPGNAALGSVIPALDELTLEPTAGVRVSNLGPQKSFRCVCSPAFSDGAENNSYSVGSFSHPSAHMSFFPLITALGSQAELVRHRPDTALV